MDLPEFVYHPDPIATGAVTREPVDCLCCGRERPLTYAGPVFAEEELDSELCPWCIADGSAAARFDATFTDVPAELPAEVAEVVLRRTPGFTGRQQERWLAHCGDAAEFHGPVGAAELASLPDARESVRAHLTGYYGWPAEVAEALLNALRRDGDGTAYLFRCRHCATHLAYADFA
ncbi:CbrC family protein [Actinoplanes sp. L3-i22]|uniref:CbrC family protein n=1 Tax=Actinoplanes sp. L3-i22 TaxID=2836373 RepID=UPI002105A02C|nr:CbrC family protein [Actinoplanes sp. L3-i22]